MQSPRQRAQLDVFWKQTRLDAKSFAPGEVGTLELGDSIPPRFPLLTDKYGQWTFHIPPGGRVVDGPKQSRAVAIALEPDAPTKVSLGNLRLEARVIDPSPAVGGREIAQQELLFGVFAALALLVAICVGTYLHTQWVPEPRREVPLQPKYIKLITPPPKPTPKVKEKKKAEEALEAEKSPKAPVKEKNLPPSPDRTARNKQKVTALLARAFGGGAPAFGKGGNIGAALGSLKTTGGTAVGSVGGIGARTGSGSGGLGGSGLGIGGLGTGGARGAGFGGRGKDATRIVPGNTTVIGGLERSVILNVVMRHQAEIKYCYESQLNQKPDLAGKIQVNWTIDPAGSVSEAQISDSSLEDLSVQNCMLQRIRRWKFPEPVGGGVVSVTFPWHFKPAGSDS